jgi:sodium/potassium-transporting ATPase subunit alpha
MIKLIISLCCGFMRQTHVLSLRRPCQRMKCQISSHPIVQHALSTLLTVVVLFIKGAPDILLKRCTSILLPSGEITPLTEELTNQLTALQGTWSSLRQRVLLLARRIISTSEILPKDWTSEDASRAVLRDFTDDLTVIGMIGIVDPPRKDIPDVVRICRGGGI